MVVSYIKLFLEIQKSNLKIAFISKADSIMNIIFMIANNLAFVFMWWILFSAKKDINGWQVEHIYLMLGINNIGFAIYALFARGVETLPEYIEKGSLDNYLNSPRNTLFMIATSESTFANWGDIITGIILIILSGFTSFGEVSLFFFVSIISSITFIFFRLFLSSLSFFREGIDRLTNSLNSAFLIFSSQPGSIFNGWYKFLYLTIIPAGFVSLIPVEIITSFSWKVLLLFLSFNIAIFFIAVFTFNKGLKNYSSGNRFGVK